MKDGTVTQTALTKVTSHEEYDNDDSNLQFVYLNRTNMWQNITETIEEKSW